MTRLTQRAVDTLPRRHRLAFVLIALPLVAGLVVGSYSYLSRSLRVPGVVRMASIDVLRERGAQKWVEFCGPIAEPRFWPECIGDAPEERERGADAFVAFCLYNEPARVFGNRNDCNVEEQPPASLVDSPQSVDLLNAAIAAGLALAITALATGAYRLAVRRPRARAPDS
jgi:hypothetical protein